MQGQRYRAGRYVPQLAAYQAFISQNEGTQSSLQDVRAAGALVSVGGAGLSALGLNSACQIMG